MPDGNGWLQISTSGFASFNKSRPAGHLVKELVQNVFDAIGEASGEVRLNYRHGKDGIVVECYNNERTHQGKMCCGRTPIETMIDGKQIWKEKFID